MVDVYQCTYEYSAGNSISFKAWLTVSYKRIEWVDTRVDGTRVVTTTGQAYRIFTGTALIDGATMDTLDGVQMGAITFSGAYPRITVLYWNGATTETNIEVIMTNLQVIDKAQGWWNVALTLEEKDQ